MKSVLMATVCMAVLFICCHRGEKEAGGPILAKIDGYNLTLDEFETQLAEESEYNPEYIVTETAKTDFLERLIRKELLIQTAKKMKLDQEPRFMRTIERYWEATLIRDIMELKSRELEKKAYVTQAEIQKAYTAMTEEDNTAPPLEQIREPLLQKLKSEKKQELFLKWVDELRERSQIEINHALLE